MSQIMRQPTALKSHFSNIVKVKEKHLCQELSVFTRIHPVYACSRRDDPRRGFRTRVKVETRKGYREYVRGRWWCTANREIRTHYPGKLWHADSSLRYYPLFVSQRKLLRRYIFFRICVLAACRPNALYRFVNCARADLALFNTDAAILHRF